MPNASEFSEFADVLKLISSGGAVVFLGWLLLHLFKVEIPRRDALYAKMLKDSTDDFRKIMTEQRQDFREELKSIRDEHKGSSERLSTAIDTLTRSGVHIERKPPAASPARE